MGQGRKSVETQGVTEDVEPHTEPLSQQRLLVIQSRLYSKLFVAAYCLYGMKCESLSAGWSSGGAEEGADAPACVPKSVVPNGRFQLYQYLMLKT